MRKCENAMRWNEIRQWRDTPGWIYPSEIIVNEVNVRMVSRRVKGNFGLMEHLRKYKRIKETDTS